LSGTIDAPIGRHPRADYKFAVMAEGRHSVTHYETLEAHRFASLLEIHLETGRTHQIRVHLAHIGHPILGDATYGTGFKTKAALLPPDARAALEALGRQALHAYRLGFEHPVSGETLDFRSELPADLRRLRDALATP
jgi:23S rRNA pseudouridine1911/1915/1917 synthase